MELKINSTVSYQTGGKADRFRFGRVIAKEIYECANGIRVWWYVRWFCDNGRPDAEPTKHHASELVVEA